MKNAGWRNEGVASRLGGYALEQTRRPEKAGEGWKGMSKA